jgi:hypothetical protein
MLTFARAFPRVDDEYALSELAGCPATQLSLDSAGSIDALLGRWSALLGHSGGMVALVATTPSQTDLTSSLADAINRGATDERPPARPSGHEEERQTRSGSGGGRLVARAAGAPDVDGDAERVALASDLAVLIVSRGAKDVDVERAVHVLSDYGRPAAWAVLVMEPKHRQEQA